MNLIMSDYEMESFKDYREYNTTDNDIYSTRKITFDSGLALTNCTGVVGDFQILPSNLNVFRDIDFNVLDKAKGSVKESFNKICDLIIENLIIESNKRGIYNILPSIIIELSENGSMLVEWNSKSFRIGFGIDENDNESSWHCITNKYEIHSGLLKTYNLSSLIKEMVLIVLNNAEKYNL